MVSFFRARAGVAAGKPNQTQEVESFRLTGPALRCAVGGSKHIQIPAVGCLLGFVYRVCLYDRKRNRARPGGGARYDCDAPPAGGIALAIA